MARFWPVTALAWQVWIRHAPSSSICFVVEGLLPHSIKINVKYKQCKDIDFTSVRTMKMKLDSKIASVGGQNIAIKPDIQIENIASNSNIPVSSSEELEVF